MTRTQIDEDAMEVPVKCHIEEAVRREDETIRAAARMTWLKAAEMAEARAKRHDAEAETFRARGDRDAEILAMGLASEARALAAAYRAKAEDRE